MKFYAGIGSRKTPENVLDLMRRVAILLAEEGYTLRSGGADGADLAFEIGCDQAQGTKEIYIPWKGFNGHYGDFIPEFTFELERWTSQFHPAWNKLSDGAKKLHMRNVYQIFGFNQQPVNMVICWTPNGEIVGGTATAIKIAQAYNIPVINLGALSRQDALNKIYEVIK